MAERYLAPAVAQLAENASRRPVAWAEDRIRRDGRRYYAASKEARLRELLIDESSATDPDTRRKLTNLASAEASRKKKQFIQDRSFQALRRICAAQRSLAKAITVLVAANERQRKENLRIAALLTAATNGNNNNGNGNDTPNEATVPPQAMALDITPQHLTAISPPTSFDILSSPVTSCAASNNNNNNNNNATAGNNDASSSQFAALHHHEAVMSDRTSCGKTEDGCENDDHFNNHHAQHDNHNNHGDRANKDVGVMEEDRFVHFGTVDAERFLTMH